MEPSSLKFDSCRGQIPNIPLCFVAYHSPFEACISWLFLLKTSTVLICLNIQILLFVLSARPTAMEQAMVQTAQAIISIKKYMTAWPCRPTRTWSDAESIPKIRSFHWQNICGMTSEKDIWNCMKSDDPWQPHPKRCGCVKDLSFHARK